MNPLNSIVGLSISRLIPRSAFLRQRGQGMTEYLIVVALIAVAAIGVYTLLGQTIRNQTAGLALEVSGQDASSAISGARSHANTAQSQAATRKGLDNYNSDNR
jgi:Tfp pilus assembly protein FimT